MGKTTGCLEYSRELAPRRPVTQRVNDWFEIYLDLPEETLKKQGARCMDCGVPFCQTGCPVNNLIPDWNDLVYRGRWKEAVRQLHATNNFPEFTGRICPAPCEASCVLSINQPAVAIKQNEKRNQPRELTHKLKHCNSFNPEKRFRKSLLKEILLQAQSKLIWRTLLATKRLTSFDSFQKKNLKPSPQR